jgi:hypothetical protein
VDSVIFNALGPPLLAPFRHLWSGSWRKWEAPGSKGAKGAFG